MKNSERKSGERNALHSNDDKRLNTGTDAGTDRPTKTLRDEDRGELESRIGKSNPGAEDWSNAERSDDEGSED